MNAFPGPFVTLRRVQIDVIAWKATKILHGSVWVPACPGSVRIGNMLRLPGIVLRFRFSIFVGMVYRLGFGEIPFHGYQIEMVAVSHEPGFTGGMGSVLF